MVLVCRQCSYGGSETEADVQRYAKFYHVQQHLVAVVVAAAGQLFGGVYATLHLERLQLVANEQASGKGTVEMNAVAKVGTEHNTAFVHL